MATNTNKGDYAKMGAMGFGQTVTRQYAEPLDNSEILKTKNDAIDYAKTGSYAYVGQILKVVPQTDLSNDVSAFMIVDSNGNIKQLATTDYIPDVDANITIRDYIDNPNNPTIGVTREFAINKLTEEQFKNLPSLVSSEIYLVSDYTLSANNKRILGVGNGIEPTDAINFNQLTTLSSNAFTDINEISVETTNKIIYENTTDGTSDALTTLKIHEMTLDVYQKAFDEDNINGTDLYLINDYILDGGGNPIRNVGRPVDACDAVRKIDIDDIATQITTIKNKINDIIAVIKTIHPNSESDSLIPLT